MHRTVIRQGAQVRESSSESCSKGPARSNRATRPATRTGCNALGHAEIDGLRRGTVAPQFESFTSNPDRATAKLERIVERADQRAPDGERLFEALHAFLADGHALHILLGNH